MDRVNAKARMRTAGKRFAKAACAVASMALMFGPALSFAALEYNLQTPVTPIGEKRE